MKRAVAVERGVVTDKYAFNILEVRDQGDSMFFWRSNEAMGAFQTYASEEWQETRQKKKEAYSKNPEGWSSAHSDSGAAPAQRWGDGGSEADPWGQYQWPRPSQDKRPRGWNKEDC